MARPLRMEFPGALYHVTSRGNRREAIYLTDHDRHGFLKIVGDVCERYNWIIHAYCLMGNHYHLLVETPDGNLSKGMRQLNGVYTKRFNRAHDRVGHLYQGRYQALIIQKDSYLLEVARYTVLNPVRARMVSQAADWPWSSFLATVSHDRAPVWLDTSCILAHFSTRRTRAGALYRQFVAEGSGQPPIWDHLKNQVYLGDNNFIEEVQTTITKDADLSEIPARQRRSLPKPLYHYVREYQERDLAMRAAYQSGGYTMKDLAHYFGLHYSSVSRIINGRYYTKRKT